MESWVVGYDGDDDVERHADMPDATAHARPRLHVRVVADYICPWCYIGEKRFERLTDDFDVQFDLCAFELRPGLPAEGALRAEVYKDRVYPPGHIENMLAMAAASGIDMKRPALVPNTHKAHEATEFARDAGAMMPFHRAVYHAYWEDERNIGDPAVLSDIAAPVGLDPEALRTALSDGRYSGRIEEQLAWGRAAGITSVPSLILEDRFAVVGAQDYDTYRAIAHRLLTRTSEDASGQT